MVMEETMVVRTSCVATIPYTLRMKPHRSWFSPWLRPGYRVLVPPVSKSISTSPPTFVLLTFVYPNIFSFFLSLFLGFWVMNKVFSFFWFLLLLLFIEWMEFSLVTSLVVGWYRDSRGIQWITILSTLLNG